MKTRKFTERDFSGFAGAEGWDADTVEATLPLIAEGRFESCLEFIAVFDSQGIDIYIMDKVGNQIGVLARGGCASQSDAERFAESLGEPKGLEDIFFANLDVVWDVSRC